MDILNTTALCLGSAIFTFSCIKFGDLLSGVNQEFGARFLVVFFSVNLAWVLFFLAMFV